MHSTERAEQIIVHLLDEPDPGYALDILMTLVEATDVTNAQRATLIERVIRAYAEGLEN